MNKLSYNFKNLQAGRRQRLWRKIDKYGTNPLSDQEILEVCLYIVNARKDTYQIAKMLLKQGHNITNCILMKKKSLMQIPGINTNTIHSFRVLEEFCKRFIMPRIQHKNIITNWQHVIEYLRVNIGNKYQEHVVLLFLDNKNQLIQDEIHQIGSCKHVYIYPLELVRRCIDIRASALIIAHNHPSDQVMPSQSDISQTQELQKMLQVVNIKLHDHIIIGPSNFLSFRTEKIIN